MNKGIVIFILMILSPVVCFGVPSVSTATLDGTTITITGSSFGTKSPAAPVFVDDFESGSNGADLSTDSDWNNYSGSGSNYSNTTAYSGSLSAHNYFNTGEGTENFRTNYHTYTPSSEMYYTYMSKVSNSFSGIFKNGRITSAAGHYDAIGGVALSDHYAFYNNGFESQYQSSGEWPSGSAGNSMAEIQATTWKRHELYRRDSTEGVADGEVYARVGSEDKYDTAAETRASGYGPYNMDSVLLGLMVSNLGNSAHAYIDDVYVDNTRARVEVCDSATWSLTSNCNPQPPTAWSDTSITVTLNDTALTGDLYAYVVDSSGVMGSGVLVATGSTYYLSPTGSDAGDGSVGSPWKSLHYALSRFANDDVDARVGPGDTLYLRGGTYDVSAMTSHADGKHYLAPNTNAGSATMTIKSYPGEWAILDGAGSERILTLYGSVYNVVLEDFEIRNGLRYGFDFGEGATDDQLAYNFTFRNLYFHDNNWTDANDNPAGMTLSGINCVIEYCTFEDNGTIGSSHYNSNNLSFFNDYTKYPENYPRSGNVVRYSHFIGSAAQIKDKGDFNLTDSSSPNENNRDDGNEIHHNLFEGALDSSIVAIGDFADIHHNLFRNAVAGVEFDTHEMTDATIWYGKVYNNTFVGITNFAVGVTDSPLVQFTGMFQHDLYNNLTYNSTADSWLFWTGQSTRDHILTSDYNVWDDGETTVARTLQDSAATMSEWQAYGYDINGSRGDVQFENAGTNDYRLATGSEGENAGNDAGDVGAFAVENWYADAGYYGTGGEPDPEPEPGSTPSIMNMNGGSAMNILGSGGSTLTVQ